MGRNQGDYDKQWNRRWNKLKNTFPPETWDRADEIVNNYDDWYNNVATSKQKVIADSTLGTTVNAIGNADGESIIRYGLD